MRNSTRTHECLLPKWTLQSRELLQPPLSPFVLSITPTTLYSLFFAFRNYELLNKPTGKIEFTASLLHIFRFTFCIKRFWDTSSIVALSCCHLLSPSPYQLPNIPRWCFISRNGMQNHLKMQRILKIYFFSTVCSLDDCFCNDHTLSLNEIACMSIFEGKKRFLIVYYVYII